MKPSPRDTAESKRKITRRGLILGGAQLVFMGGLTFRMRYMQVEQADQFRLLAEENRINIRLIPPTRGLIYDRNGLVLARNEQNYRIVMVREDVDDVDEALARISRIIPMSPEDLARTRKELKRRSPFVPVTVADRVTWDQVAEVAVNAPALPGVSPERGLSREYPMGADFAHVIGYVGPVSDYDLSQIEDPDPLLQIPKFQIGKVGVETKLEEDLRGKAGSKRIEVNAAGRVMRELSRDPGTPGKDVKLTIDARLQNFAQTRLKGESAAAVVMDCENGDLLALGSAPAFDPNLFTNRAAAVARLQALPSQRREKIVHSPSFTRADLNWRIEFRPDLDVMEVDFSGMSFEHSRDVNDVYDFIEEQITATGRKWFFLVNYENSRIQAQAWVQYARRGKALNEIWALGSVRYAPGSETEADIRLRAESQGFRPNIRNTRAQALERIAEMKAEMAPDHASSSASQ